MSVPLHLVAPSTDGHLYGHVEYDAGENEYVVEAEPSVLQMVKRVLPGCVAGRRSNGSQVRFKATRRAVEDLNWVMLRYPLRVECGERLEGDRLKAIEHAGRRERNHELKRSTPPPCFTGTLFDYQAEGVTFLLQNERTLLADDMGLGKTVVALGALAAADAWPAVVVVPPSVQRQWGEMVDAFLDLPGEELWGGASHLVRGFKTYDLPKVPIYVIHYGLIRAWWKELLAMNPRAVVFDEIHDLRHTGTKKYSAASMLSEGVSFAWGLSGTPIFNYGSEIHSVMNVLDHLCLGGFESFTREWCEGYGVKVVSDPHALGDYLRREGMMLRHRKADVQSQLPPKRRVVTDVDHDDDLYRSMIGRAVALSKGYANIKDWHEKGKTKREIEQLSRKASGVAKADYVGAFVGSLVAAGEKVLLFAWHHDVHDILLESLDGQNDGLRVVCVTGRESVSEKAEAVRSFGAGEADVVLLSLRATAGLDGLQGKGTCVVFAELDWSPAVHSQCEDRLHRIGVATDSVMVYYLVSATGYDEVIQERLGLKVGQFLGLMGDEGESDEDRAASGAAVENHLDGVIAKLLEQS